MHTLGYVQRLYDFFRRHPTGVDSFWAVMLLGLSAMWITSEELYSPGSAVAGAIVAAFALSLVVALRRRAPDWMLLLAIVTGVVQIAADVPINPGDFAMLVIVYTVAAQGSGGASRLALVVGLCASPVATLRWPSEGEGHWGNLVAMVFLTVPFALAWVIGDSLRTRRAYYAQLEERAARLQREREAQSKAAVAAERARIARELHDVVAHNVSVMVVQADGAAYVLDASPSRPSRPWRPSPRPGGRRSPRCAGCWACCAATTTRAGSTSPARRRPAGRPHRAGPGSRAAGAVRRGGRGAPAAQRVELTAYRIVQEALTNTRKHGGPEVSATVRLSFGDSELALLIEDDGRGAQHELFEDGGEDGLGQGLIGMRERVGMVSGTLDAGPRPGGGFRISAVLPVKTTR